MKKKVLIVLVLLFTSSLFSQEIKVINSKVKEKTILNFTTTTGKQVPIYRPMGEVDFDKGSESIILRKIQLIGSAPLSLEVDQGFYKFQLYENGPHFNIDAQGGTQNWLIKPGSESYTTFFFLSTTSWMFSGVSGFVFAMMSDTTSGLYDESQHIASGIGLGVLVTTAIATTIAYFVKKPTVKQQY